MNKVLWLCFLLCVSCFAARADDFFDVEGVAFHQSAPQGEVQPTKSVPQLDSNGKNVLDKNGKPIVTQVPVPFIEARIYVKQQIKTSATSLKVYFYDENQKLLTSESAPYLPDNAQQPVFIPKDAKQTVLFAVPDSVSSQENWSALIVFGDTKGVDAQIYSTSGNSNVTDFDFPEKNIIEDKDGPPIVRKTEMDPLIEHVVQTDNPAQPQITMFMRPPLGMTDASEAKGVLCLSLLAGSLDGVKRQLQGFEAGTSLKGILKFAEDHKLIIICWGSRGLWNPVKNWDDLSPDDVWKTDAAFDQVANAWENGVQYFVKEYGIPPNGYLMWGMSGSGQYACRLALRKPDYFLAVHIHIPSSFDKPTKAANKILWCLTTGEQESGYQRSLRFYSQCRALGYPMIYKAVIGLGHAESPISDNLGLKFFEYALTVRDQRLAYDQTLNDPLKQFDLSQNSNGDIQAWLDSFVSPPYVGDDINQEVFPSKLRSLVPVEYFVPLPTQEIATAWGH